MLDRVNTPLTLRATGTNLRSGFRLLSRPMHSAAVRCEEIHSGRLQTTAAYKASTEQLITGRNVT